jgi:hypothetical protein
MPGDRIEHFQQHLTHDLANSSQAHETLIHSLSHGDWHGGKQNKAAASEHLPKTELTDHGKAPINKETHWQGQLIDKHEHPATRLSAAHQLFTHGTQNLSGAADANGQSHLHIDEKHTGGDRIHVVITRQEGKQSKILLEGTIDASGHVLKASCPDEIVPVPKKNTAIDCSPLILKSHHKLNNRESHKVVSRSSFRSTFKSTLKSSDGPNSDHSLPQFSDDGSSQLQKPAADLSSSTAPEDIVSRFRVAEVHSAGSSDKLIRLPDDTVYLRTHLRVDADGGPQWNVDACGQAGTSLRDADGKPLNAMAVNYFVLPIGREWKEMGIRLGDIAWVRNRANGKIVPAIFGDEGPHNKIGEGSQGLCSALGLSNNPFKGGTDQKDIEFLISPHSGNGKGDIAKSEQLMASRLLGSKANSSLA